MCFAYRLPVHAVAVILLPSRAESTIDTGYSNVPSVLTDVKARLQMTLRYGKALMVSSIAGQRLANPLMPREPAHALSEWHRSGRAALNAAGGQVRTSVRKVTLCAKLATAFGKRPVAAKKPTDRHATAMANDPRPTNRRRSGIQRAAMSSAYLSRDDSALARQPRRPRAPAELRGRRAAGLAVRRPLQYCGQTRRTAPVMPSSNPGPLSETGTLEA